MTERRHPLIRLIRPALIVCSLAALALIVPNLAMFDQLLDDDYTTALPMGSNTAPSDDAMRFILGLTSESGRDPQRVGAARLAARLEATDQDENIAVSDSGPDQVWLDRYPSVSCNARSQLGCLERLRQDLARTPVEDPRLRLMLNRYRALRNRTGFDEAALLQSRSPLQTNYGMLLRLARLNTALRLHEDGMDAALSELQADRVFWEMMLRESDSMLARMVAVAGLWTQLQFVSELVATQTLTPEQLQQGDAIVRALPPQARDLGAAFATEQAYLVEELHELQAQSPLPRRLLVGLTMQPNATLNRFNRQITRPMIDLAKLGPVKFRQRAEKGLQPDFSHRVFPPGLYNLGGTLLLRQFRSYRPWDYIGRIHDLSAMLGLVRLQIRIQQARTNGAGELTDAAIERVIDESTEHEPDQPVHWLRQDAMLQVECWGESVCQIAL